MEQELLRVIDGICTIRGADDEGMNYEDDDERAEDEYDGEPVIPKETCIESLRDLQRLIRRDDPQKGTVKLLLGTMYAHGVVHKIIVPLITLKVLILITMAVSDKISQYDEQMSILRKHKMALLTKPFMSFLFSQLEQPLRRLRSGGEGNEIETQDVQTVELVLALIRNILLIPDSPRGLSSTLQDTLIGLFYDECILDAILIIIGISEDHKQWSLVLLDIIYFLFKKETPESLWNEYSNPNSTINSIPSSLSSLSSSLSASSSLSSSSSSLSSTFSGVGSTSSQLLAQKLRAEGGALMRKKGLLLNRPPRFYKPFVVSELDGHFLVSGTSIPDSGPISCASPSKPAKAGVVLNKHRMTKVSDVPTSEETRSTPRTRAILREYAGKFLESGYPILLRTVTDFIKNSPEGVLPSDSLNRLWLIYFFTSFHFLRENELCKSDPAHVVDIAPVAGSMDVESFTSIVQFIEKFDMSETAPSKTAVATAILTLCELLRILLLMVSQKEGSEMHEMGVSLALNLFHDTTLLLNRIPIMIAKYTPKTRSIKELEALVEVADVLMETVRTIIRSGTEIFVQSKRALVFLDKAKKDEMVLFKDSQNDIDEIAQSNKANKIEKEKEKEKEEKEKELEKKKKKEKENDEENGSGSESEYEDVYSGVDKGSGSMEVEKTNINDNVTQNDNMNENNTDDNTNDNVTQNDNTNDNDITQSNNTNDNDIDKSGKTQTQNEDEGGDVQDDNKNTQVSDSSDKQSDDGVQKNDDTQTNKDVTQTNEETGKPNGETEEQDEYENVLNRINSNYENEEDYDYDNDNDGADEEHEAILRYSTYITLFCNNAVIENYVLMLSRLDALSNRTLGAIISTLTRLISDVPGAKAFFWQLPLFRTFERIFTFCKTATVGPVSQEKRDLILKIRDLITQILTDFFVAAEKDESLYIKIFYWRSKGLNRNITKTTKESFGDDVENVMAVEEEEEEVKRREEERKANKQRKKSANNDSANDNVNDNDNGNDEEGTYQVITAQIGTEKQKESEKGFDENTTLEDIFGDNNDDEVEEDNKNNDDDNNESEKNTQKKGKLRRLVRERDDFDDDDDDFGMGIYDDDNDYSNGNDSDNVEFEPAQKKRKSNHNKI